VWLTHLGLRNFRNLDELELDLPQGCSLFCGGNAQGKSNLLEAVYLLAVLRSHRAQHDREMVSFRPSGEAGYARVVGVANSGDGSVTRVQVDMLLGQGAGARQAGPPAMAEGPAGVLQKRIRVNGVPRRAVDAVGTVLAAIFSAEDLGLATGAPALRRRYLDLLLPQVDRGYLRALQEYQKVLMQRNHLLRRIGEGKARGEEMAFWDQQLCAHGATITVVRREAVAALGQAAADAYDRLSGGEGLDVSYRPSVEAGNPSLGGVAEELQRRLGQLRAREVAAGQTLVGPHRDDVALRVAGVDAAAFGSRGQVRCIALALRLAEARFLAQRRGEPPILLLDDVLSELDAARRRQVLAVVLQAEQAIITVVDGPGDEPALRSVPRFRVQGGRVFPS
jgi:DNA replication and repair protein RecF